jgi:Tfp pilus assembly protein PilO
MKPSTKRVLSIAFAGLFFMGAIFVYTRLILPEFAAINEKRGAVIAKENLFTEQKAAVDQVKNVITESQGMDEVRETVSLALPESPDTTDLLHQLNAIASANQATFTSFSIETPALPKSKEYLVKQLGTVRVTMALAGSYESLKGFLRGLETNVRIASVESAEIRPIPGSEVQSLNLKVEFYYQK